MKIAITDNKITTKCERSLEKEGFFIIKLPADKSLGQAVESHPDTLLFFDGKNIITTADYCEVAAYVFTDLREYRPDIKIRFTSDVRGKSYPEDCVMNALMIGQTLFAKTDTVSEAIIELARCEGYELCHVNQGYPACVTLTFGNNAVTADVGMARVLASKGIQVTKIDQGGISLPPHQYGFIGGASGVYDHKVYFLGDLNSHPQSAIIRSAIEKAGYSAVSLSDEPLTDLGGIIFL